ncbi:MAG: NADH-quinone oxidoreductase subunit H [Nitrospinae bacterium]|nr:NADH-quinone oxidoreductase subunit H [Nitrospinota bacterium]
MNAFNPASLAYPVIALAVSPFLLGLINRTKAVWAGRRGQPLLQAYYDIEKLFGKGAVYSKTTTWVFRAGPIASLGCMVTASFLVPFGGNPAALAFEGDIILFAYIMGLARFFTVAAALDTGSAFEGMGASREVFFAVITEVVFFLGLAALVIQTGSVSLSGVLKAEGALGWASTSLVAAALFVVILAENCRIPVDDPNTHLELTMIHEVMVLDHSGPDFAFIQAAQSVKLWLTCSILAQALIPVMHGGVLSSIYMVNVVLALCIAIGTVESTMARLRLINVPQLIVGAGALCALGLILLFR